ncbi:MAG TPA: DUF4114 domain-containing protein [Hanamia sp.]
MKLKNYLFLIVVILIIGACHKASDIKPNNFPNALYQSVEPYNSQGKPDNLIKDTVPQAMTTYINETLIDGKNEPIAHPELFTGVNTADISINEPSDVFVTFVSGYAGFSNTLAYYTYTTGQPPTTGKDVKLITYIFPSAGRNNPLEPGDKMYLGKFNAGTTVGFLILQNAWDTTKSTVYSNAIHFCSTDALNPEADPKLKRHAVLLNYPGAEKLIGFEDTERTSPNCDNDFNDVVFYCTVTPN